MIFLSSDTHFNHASILRHCPWRTSWASDVDDMNRKLIEAWNATVTPDDIVYHLGDFSFGLEPDIDAMRKRLNGDIRLALGNHDGTKTRMLRCGFRNVEHFYNLHIRGRCFGLIHDPSRVKKYQMDGCDVLLHGHHHGLTHHEDDMKDVSVANRAKSFDVGVDAVRQIKPSSIDEIIVKVQERPVCPLPASNSSTSN